MGKSQAACHCLWAEGKDGACGASTSAACLGHAAGCLEVCLCHGPQHWTEAADLEDNEDHHEANQACFEQWFEW